MFQSPFLGDGLITSIKDNLRLIGSPSWCSHTRCAMGVSLLCLISPRWSPTLCLNCLCFPNIIHGTTASRQVDNPFRLTVGKILLFIFHSSWTAGKRLCLLGTLHSCNRIAPTLLVYNLTRYSPFWEGYNDYFLVYLWVTFLVYKLSVDSCLRSLLGR